MSLFYAMRPSDVPIGFDSERQRPIYNYTRFRGMQDSRDRAMRDARRVRGRAYEYDGENHLLYDAQDPDKGRAPDKVTDRDRTKVTLRDKRLAAYDAQFDALVGGPR